MRIAVPSDDGQSVSKHMGRCSGFVIFSGDQNGIEREVFRLNTMTAHAQGLCDGSGSHGSHHTHTHGSLLEALADCEAVVVGGLGPRLLVDLRSKGIAVYLTEEDDALTAARLVAEGRLEEAVMTTCGCHGHGHGGR